MIDLVRGRLSLGTITTINDNRAALGDEPRRDLFADPRSSSGDDSNLILETHGRSIEALESDKPALCRQEMIPQQFVERFRALLREEDSRSLQLHGWLCSGYRIGQPVRPLHGEVDVIRTPDDKGRSL
jgi:hypothetical protein